MTEYKLLKDLKQPNDIKNLDKKEYKLLAREIRRFLIQNISRTGGHLASNLGTVELTMALHLEMDFPQDKLIWDVGHQSYTHKILTGRQEGFKELRQLGGMSGFPKTKESPCDAFDTGHSSTSISAALGFVKVRDIKGETKKVAAVIGDGALSGGMAFEALNNAGRLKSNLVIVLNDNNMSITENVGGMANYLGKIRTGSHYQNLKDGVENAIRSVPKVGDVIADKIKRSKDSLKRLFIPGMLFEDMGVTYIGPIDGHNVEEMQEAFHNAFRAKKAVLVHVITKKGKGYSHAEKRPWEYHGIEAFHIRSGRVKQTKGKATYTKIFGDSLIKEAKINPDVVAVCAAMPSGTGLMEYREAYPDRYFDVGIAEQHAVTFAAGMAAAGMHPVVAIYSTFLQRAYDQILHDVCIDGLPVTFAIDRGGIVGNDGETHQGIFDLSYLNTIPGIVVLAPKNKDELSAMLHYSIELEGPSAIRYPRGEAYDGLREFHAPLQNGKSEIIYKEKEIALLAVGSMNQTAAEVRRALKEKGHPVSHINVRFVKPVDTELLDELSRSHSYFVTMEENVLAGGYGGQVAAYFAEKSGVKVIQIGIEDTFVEQGDTSVLKKKLGLDAEEIIERIEKAL